MSSLGNARPWDRRAARSRGVIQSRASKRDGSGGSHNFGGKRGKRGSDDDGDDKLADLLAEIRSAKAESRALASSSSSASSVSPLDEEHGAPVDTAQLTARPSTHSSVYSFPLSFLQKVNVLEVYTPRWWCTRSGAGCVPVHHVNVVCTWVRRRW